MIIWGGNASQTGGRYNPATNSWTATSTSSAPSGRWDHTGVWTGSEMIVWGGLDAFGFVLNTGGKYNPDTNSWTSTNTTNAPDARYRHTAIWTGSEMIVWGGADVGQPGAPPSFFKSGRRYNPNTDTWTVTSMTNAPANRFQHTAVWTGSEMIVWGGTSQSGVINTGGRYNPSANSWTATSPSNAPSGRTLHTAVWTGSEMIVWGGFAAPGATNTGGRYNRSANS
jgi:N-acetylneuraminic acid mutarotase